MNEAPNKKYIDSNLCKILYMIGILPFLLLFSRIIIIIQETEMRLPRVLLYFAIIAIAFVFVYLKIVCVDEKRKLNFTSVTAALFCTYSYCLFIDAENSLIWLILYGFTLLYLRRALVKEVHGKVLLVSYLLGVLFAAFVFFGEQLDRTGKLEIMCLGNDLYELTLRFSYLIGQIFLFSTVLATVFSSILEKEYYNHGQNKLGLKAALPELVFMLLGMLLLWLPYYYAYYPGILTVDSIHEIEQCLGLKELSNHHPYIHQLLVGFCLKLGGDSLEKGVGIYSMLQMLALAVCFSAAILFLRRMGANRTICAGVYGFFAIFPVNPIFANTMWKDVPHGMVCLLLMMALIHEVKRDAQGEKHKYLRFTMLIALLFFFCTFRNNGWYAFLLGFPLFIISNRKKWKRLFCAFLVVVILVSGYYHVLFDLLGIKESSVGESLSVPLQQVARVSRFAEVGETEEGQILKEVFYDFDSLKEKYNPILSDNIKAADTFNAEKFNENPIRYIKAWAGLGLKYPLCYIEAFLMQCYGYWYPDASYWIVSNGISPNALGLANPVEREGLRNELHGLVTRFSIAKPISFIFSLGLMVWLMIIAAALLCLKGQGRLASPLWIFAMLWFTTLASPVFCEYRYLYGLVISVPLFLGLALGVKNKAEISE